MAIFQETVPKSVYDDLQRRFDDLLEKYHALRMVGHGAPAKITQLPPKLDGAQQAISGIALAAKQPSLVEAAQKLRAQHPNLSSVDALREVARLYNESIGKTAGTR